MSAAYVYIKAPMDTIADAVLTYKGAAVALWLGLLFALERLRPAAPRPDGPLFGWRRLGRNGSLFAVNIGLSLLVVLPVSVWATGVTDWRPAAWSGGWVLLVDIVLLDLWIYWWHRANHTLPVLWRFHEVHHLDRFLDTTSAVRFHFGEVLLSALARAAVIVALDIALVAVLVFETLVLISALFHHSNVRLPAGIERALSRAIITPSIHWVHHHAVRADTDSNYGTIFSFWDRLFGSRSRTQRTPGMPIGVERRPEKSLGALLLRPFRAGI